VRLQVRGLARAGLQPVSFEVAAGDCLAVQGPSGSGKTLLLRALADLDPHQGEVAVDGAACSAVPAPEWRRQVAYVPAESGWWAERVGAHFRDWPAAAALLGALHLAAQADWPVARLSTGERQRLALIRALLLQPRVLLLDEPTAALDGETTAAVERLIAERLQAGTTAVGVTHDPAQSRRIARRCLFIENGHARLDAP